MQITPELENWIADQLQRGFDEGDLVAALVTIGHEAQTARDITGTIAARLQMTSGVSPSEKIPDVTVLPAPIKQPLASGPHEIVTPDRTIRVLAHVAKPQVLVFGGLLSDEECDTLIEESRSKLVPSHTVNRQSGETERNEARTSEGTYFNHDESALLLRINSRIAAVTDWPLGYGEPLQIMRYGIGAQYHPHYDYFDPADPGTGKLLMRGGQRIATLIIYLNDPEEGGATIFPDIGLEIAAVKGNAVFFSYSRAHPSSQTLHAGAPVVRGEKWIATRWIREKPYR